MPTSDDLPFPIGGTFFQGGTTDATSGVEWEGREFDVLDLDYTTNPAKPRAFSNGTEIKRVRVVRNACVSGSGGTTTGLLLPGMLVTFKSGKYGKQVDGYVTTDAAECYPVDEFVISTGVPINDLFYIVVSGNAGINTSVDATNANFSAASVMVGLTAATSGATTSGRMVAQTLTGATAILANQVMNRIGVAQSASTTAATNSIKLVFVNYRL